MNDQHSIDDARLITLLHAYLAARYRWQSRSDWHDVIIGLPTPGLDLRYPDVPSYGLLSAWNPLSVPRSATENRRADKALEAELGATGLPCIPAFASAADRSWREPSWIVFGMPVEAFDALARRFGQLGTLWWRRECPVRLRMDARRPDGLEGDRDVDWLR
ncbi:DUF3293 domain-containing protein [Luteimonas sp BLCC-B24]|uniref:DUF3293 domain-containing protein n=1 Tax=Luteimonas sp. BLCC-B24 TaxID=3025317 RepID=UPI00234D79E7|nr:DUF3293 domain-containing protein [Luteimonas sp. BLCC-B24]MDC7806604.1 DUF3293 domain-containing protein [Luteimonas sp. BLCC-B24]